MRHRNPLLCTIGHTAFYLFYQWNIAGETSPRFRHLIKGEHSEKQVAYDTQLDWINKMFTGAKVTSLKKTHAGRS
jgi:Centromere DNA-binding protein complex CBF3 subunit, domain 2